MILVTLFLAAQLAHRFAPTPAERSPVRVLNVCQLLQVLPEVQGQVVVVVGWSSDTSEGSWLGAECANRLVTDGFTWPNEVATSFGEAEFAPAPALPRGFRWPEVYWVSHADPARALAENGWRYTAGLRRMSRFR